MMLTNYADYLQYMGTDAWVDCISIVANPWRISGQEKLGIDRGVVQPCDWMNIDYSNETLVKQCNHGSWAYCKDYPNHEWCKDPAATTTCNKLRAPPRNATGSVFRPKLKTADYVFECLPPLSRTARRKSPQRRPRFFIVLTHRGRGSCRFRGYKLQNPKA